MSVRERGHVLTAVAFEVLVNTAGFFVLVPQLAVAARVLGVTPDVMGLLFAISS